MTCINYVTNIDVDELSGGWSAMNHNIYLQLDKKFKVNLVKNINPPYLFSEKLGSKLLRMMGLRGLYPAFSNQRLDKIAAQVESHLLPSCHLNFFHGTTPWLHVNNMLPYSAYIDACFATYINVYHNPHEFSSGQQRRLYQEEAQFLSNAIAIFFSSAWALNDAKERYNLTGDNFYVAGLGGGFLQSSKTQTADPPFFLFAGLDFLGKGGDIVVNAFSRLQKDFPEFGLKIVGQRPPAKFMRNPSVEYVGFIDKNAKGGEAKMASLFASAYAFVLPTAKDMTPLVLLEAASVGCPVIATNVFGIPEIVKDGETGLLVKKDSNTVVALQEAMKQLCCDRALRDKLGNNAATQLTTNYSWSQTGNFIAKILSATN